MKVTTSVLQNCFGKYLKYAENGAEITITKNGRDIAILKGVIEEYLIGESLGVYRAENKMTYEEFKEMNTDEGRYEFIDGYVYLQASPGNKHQEISLSILLSIASFVKSKSFHIHHAPYDVELTCTNRKEAVLVQPDILIFCDHENIIKDRYKGTPMIVMEILSSNRNYDMVKKLDVYSASGIKEYWIVDPENKCILIYLFKNYEVFCIDRFNVGDVAKSSVFEGLSIDVKTILN